MRARQVSLSVVAGAIAAVGSISVYAAGGDAQPAAQLSAGTLALGAGGASALDTYLVRDAANSLGQRNGTNAQTFSVYNTYTAGTPVYERLEYFWSSNVAILRTAANGGGSARNFAIRYGNSTNNAIVVGITDASTTISLATSAASSACTNGAVAIGAARNATSGTNVEIDVIPTFRDLGTNSSTVNYALRVTPTVNYTGGTRTGKVYGIYLAPTLTSIPTGNNGGIVFSSAFTNASFPAIRFHNVADEDTNTESFEMGWHVSANVFVMRTNFSGSGTARALRLNYCNSSASVAIGIPSAVNNELQMASATFTSSVANGVVSIGRGATITATSGTNTVLNIGMSPAPTGTSTMAWRGVQIAPTINYSNGTPGAGSVYCLYIAPTNTALPTGINAGLVFSSTASALTGALMYFNTSDEVTNTEYTYARFNTNVWEIGAVKTGSGTLRGLRFGITGNSIGFLGATPVARPGAYTLNATVVTSRTLLASASATAVNCNNVLAQLIQDLQAYGLLA